MNEFEFHLLMEECCFFPVSDTCCAFGASRAVAILGRRGIQFTGRPYRFDPSGADD